MSTTCRFQVRVVPRHIIRVPAPTTPLTVYAVTQGPRGFRGPPGNDLKVFSEILPGCDGVTDTFPLTRQTVDVGSVRVFRNGLAEVPGLGFVVGSVGDTVTLTTAPLSDDVIAVSYHI